jgi:hypothetical protein
MTNIDFQPDADKRATLAQQVAELHRDSLSVALRDGFLLGMRDTFLTVIGRNPDRSAKNWPGPLPDDFVAWCEQALVNIEKEMQKGKP